VPPAALTQLDEALQYPYIRGVSHYQNWSTWETAPGVYNWTLPDAIFSLAARHNKFVILGLQMGVAAPAWLLRDPAVATVDFVHANPGWCPMSTLQRAVDGLCVSTVARAWDNPSYATRVESAVRALAARYARRPELVFVNVAGASVSGGVETNFVIQYPLSRRVNREVDVQFNFTLDKYVAVWQERIDLYLELFPQVGVGLNNETGTHGYEGGRVVPYSAVEQANAARAIRDRLVTQHPRKQHGRTAVVRTCGGSDRTALWGQVGNRSGPPPGALFAELLWEVRELAKIGNEEAYVQELNNITSAGMVTMLAINRWYNGQYMELKRPDIINNSNMPELLYRDALEATAAAMRPGAPLPWPCEGG
jgi:hypothetical protein